MFADSEAKAECTPFEGTQSDTDSKGGVSQKFDCKAQVSLRSRCQWGGNCSK